MHACFISRGRGCLLPSCRRLTFDVSDVQLYREQPRGTHVPILRLRASDQICHMAAGGIEERNGKRLVAFLLVRKYFLSHSSKNGRRTWQNLNKVSVHEEQSISSGSVYLNEVRGAATANIELGYIKRGRRARERLVWVARATPFDTAFNANIPPRCPMHL